MYCTSCKAQFPDSYRFCPFCGSKQGNNSTAQNAAEQINQTAASGAENGTVIQSSATAANGQNSAATTSDAVASNGQNGAATASSTTAVNTQNSTATANSTAASNAQNSATATNNSVASNGQNSNPVYVPAKSAKEKQEDAIWNSFKNHDSTANAQNPQPAQVTANSAKEAQEDAIWNNFKNEDSTTERTPYYPNNAYGNSNNYSDSYSNNSSGNYHSHSSGVIVSIVLIPIVLILGFLVWHFSWLGIHNDISSALGMKLSTVTLCFDARHDSNDVDTEEALECSIRHIGDFTLYTDENNEVVSIGYSSDGSESTSSHYNVCGVYPGQDKSDAEEALKKAGFHEYEGYLNDGYDYDAASDYAHLYYAGTGSDTVYMRVSYIGGVSSITYVKGNESE